MIMTDKHGIKHRVELGGHNANGTATIYVNNVEHTLKVYYRHERTWDDHLGNTPCGYYVIVPLGTERKRWYFYYR